MGDVSTEARSDEELVRDCVAGDRSAFDRLVERHQRQMYQLCYRFAGNHEDASDLAQDVFIRAYRALQTFKGESAFRTWLYRVGVNVCLNRVSAARSVSSLASIEPLAAVTEGAEAALLRSERARRVRAAIARLPPKQRATLILRAYHDLPHEEIARVVGGTVGGAKTNLHHALRRLRQLLTKDDDTSR